MLSVVLAATKHYQMNLMLLRLPILLATALHRKLQSDRKRQSLPVLRPHTRPTIPSHQAGEFLVLRRLARRRTHLFGN